MHWAATYASFVYLNLMVQSVVSDVSRICGGEYSNDLLNIFDHALDEHIHRYRIDEIQQVCGKCLKCPYFESCGGGYLPHRFDGVSFANPSLYCDALYALSERMMQVLLKDLPPKFLAGNVNTKAVEIVEV